MCEHHLPIELPSMSKAPLTGKLIYWLTAIYFLTVFCLLISLFNKC